MITEGQIARHHYEDLRREAASLTIQAYYRMHFARKNYRNLCSASTTIQSGLRGMAARNELHFRRQTKAVVIIQVYFQASVLVSLEVSNFQSAIQSLMHIGRCMQLNNHDSLRIVIRFSEPCSSRTSLYLPLRVYFHIKYKF